MVPGPHKSAPTRHQDRFSRCCVHHGKYFLYNFNEPDNPYNCPFFGDLHPIQYIAFFGPCQPSKRHLGRFSRSCRSHESDQKTDERTDHATPPVAIGRVLKQNINDQRNMFLAVVLIGWIEMRHCLFTKSLTNV